MPHVDVMTPGLTLGRLVYWLRRELGDGYRVSIPRETDHVKVETTPLTYATVHIRRRAGSARLSIHGGGFIVDRLINECTIARKVATALRTSPTLARTPVRCR
jgi:hypothetical protein